MTDRLESPNKASRGSSSELLSDEALERIASYKPFQYGTMVSMTVAERDALCQSLRAAWARTNEALTEQRRELSAQYDDLDDKFGRVRIAAKKEIQRLELQNAALREQLAQVKKDRELCLQVQKRGEHSSVTCPCIVAMERNQHHG